MYRYGPQKCTSENALLALQAKYGYSFQSAVQGTGHKLSQSDNKLNGGVVDRAEAARPAETEESSETEEEEAEERISVIGGERRTLLSPPPASRTPTIEEVPEEMEKFL